MSRTDSSGGRICEEERDEDLRAGGEELMHIRSAKLVCFSPTGTSKAILRGIARGLHQEGEEIIDITRPEARSKPLRLSEDELVVVSVPVYMGRVPALLAGWFQAIQAEKTPAVCVVVYGNRAYDDALLELGHLLKSRGCVPVAGGAFVGEHSFSSPGLPTAEGRPDAADLRHAEEFGERVSRKLSSTPSIDHVLEPEFPGACPYAGLTKLWSVDFIEVGEECIQCGACAEECPVGAIDPEDSRLIDKARCITCCACIKNCPGGARTMKAGQVMDAAIRLNELFAERKDPVLFL